MSNENNQERQFRVAENGDSSGSGAGPGHESKSGHSHQPHPSLEAEFLRQAANLDGGESGCPAEEPGVRDDPPPENDAGDGEASELEGVGEVVEPEGVTLSRERARDEVAVPFDARRAVMKLALPVLGEMSLMTLVSWLDMIMVGALGTWAITSVGLSNQPMFLAMSVFMSFNVGATALVARFTGAGDREGASAVARQALTVGVFLGVVLGVLGFTHAREILLLMGAREDVIGPGTGYLKVICVGFVFQASAMSLSATLRGAGDTTTPAIANAVANVTNLVGNLLLIHGYLGFPRLEVLGAGIATAVSRAVACLIILGKVMRGDGRLRISVKDSFLPDFRLIRRILKIGLPAAGEQMLMRAGQMAFARIVSSFGTTVYAAHQIALNIEGLSFNIGMAFQTASTALVGQKLGSKEPEVAEKAGWAARNLGMMFAGSAGLIFFFLGRYIALAYTRDPVAVNMSAQALKIIALAQPSLATAFILAGGLRGAGDTRWTMFTTATGIWGVRVLVGYLLAVKAGMGLAGAWIGMALDMTVRAVLITLRFKGGRWKEIRV